MAWRKSPEQPQSTAPVPSSLPATSGPQGSVFKPGGAVSHILNIVHDVGPSYLSVVREFVDLQSQIEREKTQRLAIRHESKIRLEELRGRLRQLDEMIAANRDLQSAIAEHAKLLYEAGDLEGGKVLSEKLIEFRLKANAQMIQHRSQNVSAGYIEIKTKD